MLRSKHSSSMHNKISGLRAISPSQRRSSATMVGLIRTAGFLGDKIRHLLKIGLIDAVIVVVQLLFLQLQLQLFDLILIIFDNLLYPGRHRFFTPVSDSWG